MLKVWYYIGMNFLMISPKNAFATNRLNQEAANLGLNIETWDVADLAAQGFNVDIKNFDALYVRQANPYYTEVINLARRFIAQGKVVIDQKEVTAKLDASKMYAYEILHSAGLPIPKTAFLHPQPSTLTPPPYVLKWIYGFGGKDVFLIRNPKEHKQAKILHPDSGWLVQEYIAASREFEVYVVGFKAIASILGFEIKNGFKADVKKYSVITQPSEHKNYSQILNLAQTAAKVLGRELCKVDILESQGRLYILEVNRSPGLVSFESLMGYNMAKEFVKYLAKKCSAGPRPALCAGKKDLIITKGKI